MKKLKTNAMRLLDRQKIAYDNIEYQPEEGKVDGVSAAKKIGENPEKVYKTIVLRANTQEILVCMLRVDKELDLKKVAKAAEVKSVEAIHQKELLALTGYIRGGCSPLGMKKNYRTFIDLAAEKEEYIIFSAGKIGHQIKTKAENLKKLLDVKFESII